jgi:hypothetical protein
MPIFDHKAMNLLGCAEADGCTGYVQRNPKITTGFDRIPKPRCGSGDIHGYIATTDHQHPLA